ncbi:NAD(P)/FAD-dependent oxidoreductase [Pedobacter foliorum]|uniref:NAD(P)/FAD-dependent oxidoreductase n=1 Tax=Pedobacter foliorum TaxID=2739058 RepID=UPI001566B26F|nr:NAD(P)/FAD-dependent oxidoreductase [Pedobacter foliorum]NRF38551.1 NAD(P)/FAD-dependent oxidoreductase [Pedobacter foliorum]
MLANEKKTALIIGAGPAGLTAAYELLNRTDVLPIIIEKSNEIGGISRTAIYKGNRIDIGGHRFFSKSNRVLNWWRMFMPVEEDSKDLEPKKKTNVMLIKNRLSRIFYLRTFFEYPIKLNLDTITKLGFYRMVKIGISYLSIRLSPIEQENNLEDFFINRFGKELYSTFFKDYTEKVWGMPCNEIKAEWGAQRIKGLSVSKALKHAIRSIVKSKSSFGDKEVETTLIDKFMYPRLGPGQLWEIVAEEIKKTEGIMIHNQEVVKIDWLTDDCVEVTVSDTETKETKVFKGNYLFSTMPIKDLVNSLTNVNDKDIVRIANDLAYRDFITVGLLLKKLKISDSKSKFNTKALIRDNWIYIQENDVHIGRLQIFNNWSIDLLSDKTNVWIGLEYFCNEGDNLWSMKDDEFITFAIGELKKLDIIEIEDVLDGTIIKVPKAYPAYFGSYDQISTVTKYLDSFKNMFLIGRNGMHKYNNQDHSMLTAMLAVDNLISGRSDKTNIWEVNTENDYHEETNER